MSQYEPVTPTTPPVPPQKRGGWGCLVWGIIGVAGVALLICCGIAGLGYWGWNEAGKVFKDQLATNPVVQEHLGELESANMDLQRMSNSNGDVAISLKGSKGEGTALLPPNAAPDADGIIWEGILELPDGSVYPLSGETEEMELLEPEMVEETDETSDSVEFE